MPATSLTFRRKLNLYDHLRHTLASERLGTDKGLLFDASRQVAERRGRQDDGFGNQ